MTQRYTAAIVGCGSIGHAHAEGYGLVDEVELVAVVDPLAPARQQYMEEYGLKHGYGTIEEMLEAVRPDIVSVCTWHLLHPAPTIAAARAGVKGVICEKPMAIGMAAADSMVDACVASGTKLVISHQRRFTPGWEKARALVQEKAIGDVVRVDNKVAEGLTNWGTHTIDGSRFVLGDPQAEWVMGAVERYTDRYERNTAIEDSCMGLVQFAGGVQLFIQSDLMREGASAGTFWFQGSEGMMEVSEACVRLFSATSGGWQDVDLGMASDAIRGIGGNTNAAQVRELVAWIEGGAEHRGAGDQARATVEIMMALYESARRHRVVDLPLQEKEYPLDLMIDEGQLPLEQEGTYDIRGFLQRDGIDEAKYAEMRAQGKNHHQIMQVLNPREG